MTEIEDRLRAAVTRRMQEASPSADLADRIHARVRQRRNRRRLVAGVLAACVTTVLVFGVLGVVGVDTLVPTRSDGPDGEVADGLRPPPEAPPTRGPTRPGERSTTPSTGVPEPTEAPDQPPPTAEPPPTSEPPVTVPPTTPTPPPTASDLKPPDSQQPTVRTCAPPTAQAVVEVVMNPDLPAPRCAKVTAGQRLQVRNATDQQITVALAGFQATLAPGSSELFDRGFGDYLQPGVHRVDVSLYGSTDPELWLVS